ncbi:LysE family translocator [Rhodoferax sediminis]|uniref:LysE family translocator n=1 Tax=Rhodoferax sediminis TaxID=2509614 RepID=A0A515D904_9BURK|nr:LysE family transporter [Rhodoferax sediminis]QDL36864.1 LysE family translocator [Rhodoferax sediminis]
MQNLPALLGLIGALSVGVVSPGPSFVMVARTAVATSRSEGVAAAVGMGGGGVLFAGAALLGLNALMLAVPLVYLALKVAGGLYLAWLGLRIWRSARQALNITGLADGAGKNKRRSLLLGFATQISNPKTAIVYASVFAAFLPPAPSLAFNLTLVAIVFVIETGWYTLVALALASERPRNTYLHYKGWMDHAAGGVMMALGLELVSSAYGR